MSNFWAAAALSGVGAGMGAYGRAAAQAEEDRRRSEERLAATRAEIAARYPNGRAASGGGSARGEAPFDPAMADQKVEWLRGMQPGELSRIRTGEAFDTVTQHDPSGDELGQSLGEPALPFETRARAEGWEQLREKKLAEMRGDMEEILHGDDYEKVTKGRGERQKQGFLEKYAGGDDRQGQAAMIAQGKTPYGGNSDVTRNEVTGKTEVTPVGESTIQKKGSEAQKAEDQGKAAVTKANKPTSTGGRAPDPTKGLESERKALATATENARKALESATRENRPARQAAYDTALARFEDFLKKYPNQKAGATPPAVDAGAPPATMLKEGVNTRFKNGQTWTLKNGKPVKVG